LILGLLAQEMGLKVVPALSWSAGVDMYTGARDTKSFAIPSLTYFNWAGLCVMGPDGSTVIPDIDQIYAGENDTPYGLSGALVMAFSEEGAHWSRLPNAGTRGSIWEEEAELEIDSDGTIDWAVKGTGEGVAQTMLRGWFGSALRRSGVWQRKVQEYGGKILSADADIMQDPASTRRTLFFGRMNAENYAQRIEERLWGVSIPPAVLCGDWPERAAFPNRLASVLEGQGSQRKSDILLPTGFTMTRKIRVDWPEGWETVRAPETRELTERFGILQLEWLPAGMGGTLSIHVELAPVIHAWEIDEFRRFCKEADEALHVHFTLSSKNEGNTGLKYAWKER